MCIHTTHVPVFMYVQLHVPGRYKHDRLEKRKEKKINKTSELEE